MKIVMVHECTPEVLSVDLSGFDIITFDDGLYSQYLNHKHFAKFGKPMYYFISTGIVCANCNQSKDALYCADAHAKAREGNFENYMTWKQIQELNKLYNIGGHSHSHPRMPLGTRNLVKQFEVCKPEIESMLRSFEEHKINIKSFCFPYNEDILQYRGLLKDLGITFFGSERVPIEELL